MNNVLLPFPAQLPLTIALAQSMDARMGQLAWRRFPDGESLVTVDPAVRGADVAIVASLHRPDEMALALRFAAQTARDLGARSVGLVAPYLAYMRQDARFHPGECVSAALFSHFLEESFDWLVTVDPHLHRNASLGRLFEFPATNVGACSAVAEWVKQHAPDALLIGPDAESAQWVEDIARRADVPWQVLSKVRHGDLDVEVSLPDAAKIRGRTPILVDDIVSTGSTLVAALGHLKSLGLPAATCIAIHAIFAEDALYRLYAAGAARVISTDTIPHATNAITVVPLLAQAVSRRFEAEHASNEIETPTPIERWFTGEEPQP